jgi:hypothetical protein
MIEEGNRSRGATRSSISGVAGPIFLAGVDRSGIGLLGELLDAHPEVAISRRTNFWHFYHGRFGDLERAGNLERCVNQMLQYTRIQALDPQRDELLETVRQQTPTYGRLFAALQEQHVRRLGKSRWGDKSLNSEKYAHIIFREFPNAVMVHVIRDPRDRYASQAMHRRAPRGRVGSGTALWRWSARRAHRNQLRHPGRYLVVRYEDLVTRPRTVLAEVCTFVGVPFTPEMLDVGSGDVREPSRGRQPYVLTTTSIGRHERDLTPREAAFVHFAAGHWMADLGYASGRARLSPRDRLVFGLFDVPRNVVWMGLWWVRQLFSGWPAPRPSARRLRAPGLR